jgi:hypothetical protein
MHIRVLVEDASGKIMLEHILPGLVGADHSFEVKSWKGIGRLPTDLRSDPDPRKRTLLDKLPGLLRAAGKEFEAYDGAVVVVVDLDDRDPRTFLDDLDAVLASCKPQPRTLFRLSIEEGEAWLLGDREAVKAAYPQARDAVLAAYKQDSICGTWEVLADAIHPGGAAALEKKKVAYSIIGAAKCEWAKKIAPQMEVERNVSPSFQLFVEGIQGLITFGGRGPE